VDVADKVGRPDTEHHHEHGSGEISGFTAAQPCGLAEKKQKDVEAPHDE
jgi:hypothetical protein